MFFCNRENILKSVQVFAAEHYYCETTNWYKGPLETVASYSVTVTFFFMKEAHFERLNLLIQVSELVKKFEKKSLFHIKKKKSFIIKPLLYFITVIFTLQFKNPFLCFAVYSHCNTRNSIHTLL